MNKNNLTIDCIDNLPKLKWACRRGMLELDVLLGNFLTEAYPTLDIIDKTHFIELLNYPDPLLFAWLLGAEKAEEEHLQSIIQLIRHHARSRMSS